MKNTFLKNSISRNFKHVLIFSILFSFSETIQSQMSEAYKMANDMVRNRLNNEDKENITILDNLEQAEKNYAQQR